VGGPARKRRADPAAGAARGGGPGAGTAAARGGPGAAAVGGVSDLHHPTLTPNIMAACTRSSRSNAICLRNCESAISASADLQGLDPLSNQDGVVNPDSKPDIRGMAIKLLDVAGQTGMKIIKDIVRGERDPLKLAKHRHERCKATEAQVASALAWTFWASIKIFEVACSTPSPGIG
jgi:hypothetical protein